MRERLNKMRKKCNRIYEKLVRIFHTLIKNDNLIAPISERQSGVTYNAVNMR